MRKTVIGFALSAMLFALCIRAPKITGAPGQMAPEIALRAFRLSRD